MEPFIILAVLVGVAAIFLLHAESKWETKYDQEQVDLGKIIDLSYGAEHTSTDIAPTYTFGKGGGIGLTMTSHTTPERHIVVIRGSNVYKKVIFDSEILYDVVEEGMEVKLLYANKYRQHKDTRERREEGLRLRGIEIAGTVYRDLNLIETDYKQAKGA